MAPRCGVWAGRKYLPDKMTQRELMRAYFTYHAILAYLLMATVAEPYPWVAHLDETSNIRRGEA